MYIVPVSPHLKSDKWGEYDAWRQKKEWHHRPIEMTLKYLSDK